MPVTDTTANMLTSIRNANKARLPKVDVPNSKLSQEILRIFKTEGFVKNFKLIKDNMQGKLRIYLKFDDKTGSVITGIKRISKPGRRVYVKSEKVPTVLGGYGVSVISTSKGILTDTEAREAKVGGEVICYIW